MAREKVDELQALRRKQPRNTYNDRQAIKAVAQEIADAIVDRWPGVEVRVDLDTVDDEDAYLWITTTEPAVRDKLALTALELVNSIGARMGFWVVPRVLNDSPAAERGHRLRIRSEPDARPVAP